MKHGAVARTYTQCAQAWPLASNVKLDGMESAIHILRQACDYLHEGMTRLSSITDQKCDTENVQQAIAEVMVTLQQLQAMCGEGSRRSETIASRMDELSGEAVNIRNRLEGLERRVGMEGQQHESVLRELRAGRDQCVADIGILCQHSNEYQMDVQARDHEVFELKELIFKVCVEVDEFREDLKNVQTSPEQGSVGTSDQQEQMKTLRHDLDEFRKQIEAQEKKIQDGERQICHPGQDPCRKGIKVFLRISKQPSRLGLCRTKKGFRGVSNSILDGRRIASRTFSQWRLT